MLEKNDARRVIKRIYEDVWAYTIPRNEDLAIRKASGSSLYGEITVGGLDKLIRHLGLSNDDVFFDLGSGVGKVVLQVAMCSTVKKSIGIELSSSRYESAQKALKAAVKEGVVTRQRCQFKNENILDTNLGQATVIYTCSTAFPGTFMKKLSKKLRELKKPVRIVSLQEFGENSGLYLTDKIKLDMSWTRNTPVYIFTNT